MVDYSVHINEVNSVSLGSFEILTVLDRPDLKMQVKNHSIIFELA